MLGFGAMPRFPSNHRVHVSTDRPQSDSIGHQESSLSLKHGPCVLGSLNSQHATKDEARPFHLFFGAQLSVWL